MTAGTATRERGGATADLGPRLGRLARSAVFYGVVVAVVAGVAGELLDVSPPAAYGICSACHGRDLANWLLNHTEGTKLFVTAAGAGWPLLTVVGLVLGSFAASRRNGEFSSINLGGNVRQFGFGFVVMCAALFVGGCPTRIIIRTGYGDVAAALALGGVAAGVVLATLSLRWAARR
jgi:membrane associated rhomboid family serine protease